MSDSNRESTLNNLLRNASEAGELDLVMFAIEKGANDHKESSTCLDKAITSSSVECFDYLLANNSDLNGHLFLNGALSAPKHYGIERDPEMQLYMFNTLLQHVDPTPLQYDPKNRNEHFLGRIFKHGRVDLFASVLNKYEIKEIITPKLLPEFIKILSVGAIELSVFKNMLIELIEHYRPLRLDNEPTFIKSLFKFGMSDYLNQLQNDNEINLNREETISSIHDLDDFIVACQINPLLKVDEYGALSIFKNKTITENLTEEKLCILLDRLDGDRYEHSFGVICNQLAQFNHLSLVKSAFLHVYATREGIDLINEFGSYIHALSCNVDAQIVIKTLDEYAQDPVLARKFFSSETLSLNSIFPNNMLRYTIRTKVIFEKVVELYKHLFNDFYTFIIRPSTRHSESIGDLAPKYPWIITALISAINDNPELKENFERSLDMTYKYSKRSISACAGLYLSQNDKYSSTLKGEAYCRILAASHKKIQEALESTTNALAAKLLIETLDIAPLQAMQEFKLKPTVKKHLLQSLTH
ncbi:hypothetical protein L1267_23405 [Pseudoalteromonas sp. OFAV1]|uniref:hypothetical protein n=1 Tax=Pseudoalteromonas sp. OFAV1 TaxID=2908892 RepID=UPI001F35B5E6|nr:hypothetical protein [Pseudoalteromonas sp. OFAV1]MCF2903319.1 hypothetical protein [Pseudoalteromonas sp. OFAV1]